MFTTQALSKTKLLGTEKYWKAYSTKIEKTKTCFITSEPIETEGKFNKDNRGKPYVFVTNIKNGTNHEVSIKAGFNFKKNKDVIFDVDGKKTKLFPHNSLKYILEKSNINFKNIKGFAQSWNPGAKWINFNPMISKNRFNREDYFYTLTDNLYEYIDPKTNEKEPLISD